MSHQHDSLHQHNDHGPQPPKQQQDGLEQEAYLPALAEGKHGQMTSHQDHHGQSHGKMKHPPPPQQQRAEDGSAYQTATLEGGLPQASSSAQEQGRLPPSSSSQPPPRVGPKEISGYLAVSEGERSWQATSYKHDNAPPHAELASPPHQEAENGSANLIIRERNPLQAPSAHQQHQPEHVNSMVPTLMPPQQDCMEKSPGLLTVSERDTWQALEEGEGEILLAELQMARAWPGRSGTEGEGLYLASGKTLEMLRLEVETLIVQEAEEKGRLDSWGKKGGGEG